MKIKIINKEGEETKDEEKDLFDGSIGYDVFK